MNVCATKGGQCSNIVPDFSYHNSFLIADCKEVSTLIKHFIGICHCISQNNICLKPKRWAPGRPRISNFLISSHISLIRNIIHMYISYKAWVLETADKLWVAGLKKAQETSPTAWVSLQSIENILLQYHYKVLRISFFNITTKYWDDPFSVSLQSFEDILFQHHYKVLRISFFCTTKYSILQ